jgi:C-terminal processing protease CtpA/Prc
MVWRTYLPLAALCVLFPLLLLSGCASSSGTGSSHADTWSADIAVLREELPQRHKNLFFSISEEEYHRQLDTLENHLDSLSDAEIEVAIRKLLTDVGDTHTSLSLSPQRLFPFTFKYFEEGTILLSCTGEYKKYLGMQVIAINDHPIEEIKAQLAEIIPHANQAQVWKMYPQYMVMPYYLEGLGIVTGGEAEFTFEDEKGNRHTVTVTEIPRDSDLQWVQVLQDKAEPPQGPEDIPLYLRNTKVPYWNTYKEEEKLLYFQYNSCRNDTQNPLPQFLDELLLTRKRQEIETLVVDLRFNGGGNSLLLRPFITAMEKDYTEGRDYDLYVIIGRHTFSSAILNAIDLKQKAGAVLIGEPTSGKPNHYGEVRSITLPYSGKKLNYSTKYFSTYQQDTDSLYPDVRVLWSYQNLIHWQDGAMELIRERDSAR